jgi:hypothetical protein
LIHGPAHYRQTFQPENDGISVENRDRSIGMHEEDKKLETPSQPNRGGLSIVPGVRAGRSSKVVQCPVCSQQTEYTDGQEHCGMCGAGLMSVIAESPYSGHEPNLVPASHHIYHLRPAVRTVNERRHPRIPCRNVKACIKTAQGASVVVDLVNISRGGACFMSSAEFYPGTAVSIATHYIEGGHNIYQDGQIIRVQRMASATLPGVYAFEFLSQPRLRNIPEHVPGTLVEGSTGASADHAGV